MSISHALSNAMSGLTIASRSAELISGNVSNALTPGYARRSVEVSAAVVSGRGAGARIAGVQLAQDMVLTTSRRRSDAQHGSAATLRTALSRMADQLGLPGDPGALASRASAFEAALAAAAGDPASSSRQTNLLNSAKALTQTLNATAKENSRIRMDADAEIGRQVGTLNQTLAQIEAINKEILGHSAVGRDTSALIDQRNQLVDRISTILPVKTFRRDGDQIAIYTNKGANLLDGSASTIGFSPAGIITPEMSIGLGTLSGLTLNGQPVEIGNGAASLDGGSLSALFDVRDVQVPRADAQLDAFAAEIIVRFEDASVDTTRAVGAPGLFTDAGGVYSLPDELGLAGRIAVNTAVDPAEGGGVWRLRDGLGALTPGQSGVSALLQQLADAATSVRAPAAGLGISSPMSLAGFAAELTSQSATAAAAADEEFSYLSAQNEGLRAAESASTGVNTDAEMQHLMLVEQMYAANARVISVVDSLMRRLMEM